MDKLFEGKDDRPRSSDSKETGTEIKISNCLTFSMVQAKRLGHLFTAFVCCHVMTLSVLWYHSIPITTRNYVGDEDTHSYRQSTTTLTPQELTGSPEQGSISCPSHLYPVYDRIVTTSQQQQQQQQQQSSTSYHHVVRRIPRMIHVSMKSRCLPVSFLTSLTP
jgi:hypothetical protein